LQGCGPIEAPNAVTNYSQQVASYDRATGLEKIGAEIIELPPTDWKVLTKERETP
jgi:hypothetical protein